MNLSTAVLGNYWTEFHETWWSYRYMFLVGHMKCRWNRTMLNLCGIVAAILKMATARNFSMSGHHNLPSYQI
jgi:hypothetical protein